MLRQLKDKDAAGMYEWMHDPNVQKFFRKPMFEYTEEDIMTFIKGASYKLEQGKSIHYAIVDESDEYLGTISLKEIDLIDQNAEYAISLRSKAQGQGIGMKATKEVLEIAFNSFGLNKVYLNVFEDNIHAIKMYEKCGFQYEGTFRNHVRVNDKYKSLKWYSILNEEYSL